MKAVEGLSIKEITRRTGDSRNTIRQILRSPAPPSYGPRAPRPSKLDLHKPKIHELLRKDPTIPSQVIRERITEAGFVGGKSHKGRASWFRKRPGDALTPTRCRQNQMWLSIFLSAAGTCFGSVISATTLPSGRGLS